MRRFCLLCNLLYLKFDLVLLLCCRCGSPRKSITNLVRASSTWSASEFQEQYICCLHFQLVGMQVCPMVSLAFFVLSGYWRAVGHGALCKVVKLIDVLYKETCAVLQQYRSSGQFSFFFQQQCHIRMFLMCAVGLGFLHNARVSAVARAVCVFVKITRLHIGVLRGFM